MSAFRASLHGVPLADPAAKCYACADGAIVVRRVGAHAAVPRLTDLLASGLAPTDAFSFGHHGHAPCFVVALPDTPLPDGWAVTGLRQLLGEFDDDELLVAGRALQLAAWDRDHRHCGRCGAPTARDARSWARVCTACAFAAFPRVSPAMIVLVHRGDACLLARASHHPDGMYSVLAGFVEPGESLEQCVEREVREEVGIELGDIRYVASQPWPFPHSLMVGFTAAWRAGELTPDGVEILDADWFTRDDLPERIPSRISIARRLIDGFFGGIHDRSR